uniref:Uncharacterized protein n=1 Tax=Rhizophora mucronata TaxID=61149 RepID=A0A2P2P710_RHIMU
MGSGVTFKCTCLFFLLLFSSWSTATQLLY